MSDQLIEIDEPAMAINLNRSFNEAKTAEELYDRTRACWKVNAERANEIDYAFAVFEGIIREVYQVDKWMPCGCTPSIKEYIKGKEAENEGRSEFVGEVAADSIRNKYVGQEIEGFNQNPIRYYNC